MSKQILYKAATPVNGPTSDKKTKGKTTCASGTNHLSSVWSNTLLRVITPYRQVCDACIPLPIASTISLGGICSDSIAIIVVKIYRIWGIF